MSRKRTEAAKERVEWGRRHIEAFEREARTFVEAHDQMLRAEDHEPTGMAVHRLGTIGEVPKALKLLFGDAVNNLSEACDNLVQGFARDVSPTWQVSMPIKLSPSGGQGFDAWEKQHRNLPKLVLKTLRDVQPFNTYEIGGRTQTATDHPLYVLNKLWNHNKHESPLEVVAAQRSVEVSGLRVDPISPDLDAWIKEAIRSGPKFVLTFGGEAESGAEIARTKTEGNYQVKVGVEIALRKDVPGGGRFATELLIELHSFVQDEVIARFEAI